MRALSPTVVLFALLGMGCNPSDGTGAAFEGGDFAFQTIGVTDGCLDGAFETVMMPEGEPNDFGQPIYVPALDELPMDYTIALTDPFDDMPVTVEGDESTRLITGAQNTDIEYDADNNPGCLIDAVIDVNLIIDTADEVHGNSVLSLSSFDEASCPLVDAEPCDVEIDIRGTRM